VRVRSRQTPHSHPPCRGATVSLENPFTHLPSLHPLSHKAFHVYRFKPATTPAKGWAETAEINNDGLIEYGPDEAVGKALNGAKQD